MSDQFYSRTFIPMEIAGTVDSQGFTIDEALENAIGEVFTDWFDPDDIDVDTLASDIADAAWKQLVETDITAYLRADEEQ